MRKGEGQRTKERGVTLITLIVTTIVMLLLAAIVVGVLLRTRWID